MKISKNYLDFFKRTSAERIIFYVVAAFGRRCNFTNSLIFEKGSGGDMW